MYAKAFKEVSPIGRDRFMDIVERNGLKLRQRKRTTRTTNSNHNYPLYPNLVKDLIPTRVNELWVSDITYIPLGSGEVRKFCYLSVIMDAYNKEIVGWSVGPTLDTRYPLEALRMALRRIEGKETMLIHHSDRGCQYASHEYVSILKALGILISMTENGDPKENAEAERINNTIKNELLKDMTFGSIEEVKNALERAIYFYNNDRPHMSLGMNTPIQAAQQTGEQDRLWRSYRVEWIKKQEKAAAQALEDNADSLNLTSDYNPGCTVHP